jgi:hypothetical protein
MIFEPRSGEHVLVRCGFALTFLYAFLAGYFAALLVISISIRERGASVSLSSGINRVSIFQNIYNEGCLFRLMDAARQ